MTYVLIGKIFRHIAGIERIVVPTQEFTSEKDKKSAECEVEFLRVITGPTIIKFHESFVEK